MMPSEKHGLLYGQCFSIMGDCFTIYSFFKGDGSLDLHFGILLSWGLGALCLYEMCCRYQQREKEHQEYRSLLTTRLKLLEKAKSLLGISQEQQRIAIRDMVNIYNAEIEKEEREKIEYRYPDIADISRDRIFLLNLCKEHNIDIELK